MGLKDLFVPKWKNSNAEIRRAAVDTMESSAPELLSVAKTDASPDVRIAAVRRIENPDTLNEIIATEQDQRIKTLAQERCNACYEKILATSRDPQLVVATLEKYGKEKAIAEYLCAHPTDAALQGLLIDKIKNPQLLCKITEHECAYETGERIVGLLTEKRFLGRIAEHASSKKIRLLAGKKMETLYPDPRAAERKLSAALEACCDALEFDLESLNINDLVLQLESSRDSRQRLDPERKHPQSAKIAAAEQLLADRIAVLRARKSAFDTMGVIVEQLEQLDREPPSEATEKFDSLKAQWNTIDRIGLSGESVQQIVDRYTKVSLSIKSKIDHSREEHNRIERKNEELAGYCNSLEKLVNSEKLADRHAYERLVGAFDKNRDFLAKSSPILKQFEDLKRQFNEKTAAMAEQERLLKEREEQYIQRLFAKMESAAAAKSHRVGVLFQDVASLKRNWDKSYPLAKEIKRELQSSFLQAYAKFMEKYYEFKELNSWQEWAEENVQAKLCTEVEQFEARMSEGESVTHLARKVAAFQKEWKRLGNSHGEKAREQENRFIAACERIYAIGLAKKSALLDSLKALIVADEKRDAVADVKLLQKQWNDIGYLPQELEKEIADLFYSTCNTFFEERKERNQKYAGELQANIALREEICKQAESFMESTAWADAKKSFDELQIKWDESWPAPMKRSRELWQIFSGHRDRFFERYDAYKQGNDTEKEKLCQEAESLLFDVESPLAPPESTGEGATGQEMTSGAPAHTHNHMRVLHKALDLQKKWKTSGPATKAMSDKLWNRFNPVMKKIFDSINIELDRNAVLKEALVQEAETLASSDAWNAAAQKFTEIREAWKKTGAAGRHKEQELWIRLQNAGDIFFNRRREHFAKKKEAVEKQQEVQVALIEELELLVRIAGKSHLVKNSKAASSAEILKKGIALRNEIDVEGDAQKTEEKIRRKVKQIIDKWDSVEAGNGKESYGLAKKFNALIDILRSR